MLPSSQNKGQQPTETMFNAVVCVCIVFMLLGERCTATNATFDNATETPTTTEVVVTAEVQDPIRFEDIKPGDLGVGDDCMAELRRIKPDVSWTDLYCICYFICLDDEGNEVTVEATVPSNIDDILREHFDRQLEYSKQYFQQDRIGFLIAYSLIMTIGVTGNLLVLVTVASSKIKTTATNVFIFSLALADLLVCSINIPISINGAWASTWAAGEVGCYVAYYVFYACFMVSVLTLTAMSIERWLAICYPMKAQYLSTASRARKTVALIWILGFALALPTIFVLTIGEKTCLVFFASTTKMRVFALYVLGVLFVVPVIVMSVAYGRTCVALYHSISTLRSMQSKGDNKDGKTKLDDAQGRVKVIRMLIAVLVVFVLCWAPLLVADVMDTWDWTIPGASLYEIAYVDRAFRCLTYANSCLNPILYAFLSTQFRRGFIRCLTMFCKRDKLDKSFDSSTSGATRSSTFSQSAVPSVSAATAN